MSSDQAPINLLNAAGAPDFVTVEAQQLLALAKARFESETGRTLSPSQVEMYLLETIAYMLTLRGGEEQRAFENNFIAWAQPEFLEALGADRNTPRLQAKPATTTLRFSTGLPAASRIRMPAGTRVSDVAGQVQFRTRDLAYIEAGQSQIDLACAATAPGIYANGFPVGAISSIVDPIPGIVAATNLSETGTGADIEDLDRYRARLPLAFERIGDGLTKERYVADTLAWNARCIDVAVTRPQPGYVSLFPLMDTGAPNAEELASLLSVFTASNTHQGDFIQTFEPAAHDFSFDLSLTLTDPDAAAVARAAVQTVLDGWKGNLGGYIAPSELIRVAKQTAGVVDADIPVLALALVAENAWRNGTIANVTVAVV